MKFFKTLFFLFFCVGILCSCGAKDQDIDSPLAGKEYSLTSPYLLLSASPNTQQLLTNSPTAIAMNLQAMNLETLMHCSGCHFNSNLVLKDFLPSGSKIKILKAYNSIPALYAVDSSTILYYVAEAQDGKKFTIPAYSLDRNIKERTSLQQPEKGLEALLASFANESEQKSFYVSIQPFYQKSLFNDQQPPFSDAQFSQIFGDMVAGLKDYDVSYFSANKGHLAFSVTTNRFGLAYIIFQSSERYLDISPLIIQK